MTTADNVTILAAGSDGQELDNVDGDLIWITPNIENKTVANSVVKPPTCNDWEHDWCKYIGLNDVYKYCTICDEKRSR